MISIKHYDGRLYAAIPYDQRERARRVRGAWWEPALKQWSYPESSASDLAATFPEAALDLEKISEQIGIIKKAEQIFCSSAAVNGALSSIEKGSKQSPKTRAKISYEQYEWPRAPMEHQKTMIEYMVQNHGFALLCEMGTGKTQAPIGAFDVLWREKKATRMLVICPLSLVYNWLDEVQICAPWHTAAAARGSKRQDVILDNGNAIVVLNYDALLNIDMEIFSSFDFVVLDESQRIKNPGAARTKKIVKYFSGRKVRKYILSGTPITNKSIDIFCQYQFLDPAFFGLPNWYAARARYCQMGGYGNHQIIGYRNVEELRGIIDAHSFAIKKSECLDLPEKIYDRRILDMPKHIREKYEELKSELITEIAGTEITAANALVKILRLQEISSGHYYDGTDTPKAEAIIDVLENAAAGVVIWCEFLNSIDIVGRILSSISVDFTRITGEVKAQDRQKIISDFQAGKIRVLVCQIQTCGLGVTLTAADTVIYYENVYNFELRKQSEDRTHRIGQKNKCQYIDLVYKNSIDIAVLRALRGKQTRALDLVESFSKGEF